jgi:hypothetical protein
LKGKPAITLEAHRDGQKIEIGVKGERTENWFVQLRNIATVKAVENGSSKPAPQASSSSLKKALKGWSSNLSGEARWKSWHGLQRRPKANSWASWLRSWCKLNGTASQFGSLL